MPKVNDRRVARTMRVSRSEGVHRVSRRTRGNSNLSKTPAATKEIIIPMKTVTGSSQAGSPTPKRAKIVYITELRSGQGPPRHCRGMINCSKNYTTGRRSTCATDPYIDN